MKAIKTTYRRIPFGDYVKQAKAKSPPSIFDRVDNAVYAFSNQTGKNPNCVYMGQQEVRQMVYAVTNGDYYSMQQTRDRVKKNIEHYKLSGLPIIEVVRENYLAVGIQN